MNNDSNIDRGTCPGGGEGIVLEALQTQTCVSEV